MSRRQFDMLATAALCGSPAMQACSSAADADSYERVALTTWRHGRVAAVVAPAGGMALAAGFVAPGVEAPPKSRWLAAIAQEVAQ